MKLAACPSGVGGFLSRHVVVDTPAALATALMSTGDASTPVPPQRLSCINV
jgi:hypothetical protein